MSNEITMPKLSDTMEEGKILRWLKHPGDEVHHGDAIAEVETDKADMVMESFDEGVLDAIMLKEGESAKVGAVIAVLRAKGAAAGSAPSRSAPLDASNGHDADDAAVAAATPVTPVMPPAAEREGGAADEAAEASVEA